MLLRLRHVLEGHAEDRAHKGRRQKQHCGDRERHNDVILGDRSSVQPDVMQVYNHGRQLALVSLERVS